MSRGLRASWAVVLALTTFFMLAAGQTGTPRKLTWEVRLWRVVKTDEGEKTLDAVPGSWRYDALLWRYPVGNEDVRMVGRCRATPLCQGVGMTYPDRHVLVLEGSPRTWTGGRPPYPGDVEASYGSVPSRVLRLTEERRLPWGYPDIPGGFWIPEEAWTDGLVLDVVLYRPDASCEGEASDGRLWYGVYVNGRPTLETLFLPLDCRVQDGLWKEMLVDRVPETPGTYPEADTRDVASAGRRGSAAGALFCLAGLSFLVLIPVGLGLWIRRRGRKVKS